jgi:NADPH-dependent 2,4-dienoyl-CoA reductase/sulfur reductase-like enzyme
MSRIGDWMQEPARDVRVAAQADVVVVGGGPAGVSAAVAAARNGARVTLLERYNHLGGLASGGTTCGTATSRRSPCAAPAWR